MDMKKKKLAGIECALLLIVIVQIFLLFNMTFAHSYIIHQTDAVVESIKQINDKERFKDIIHSGLNLLIGFLSIKQIGVISAQTDVEWYCCPNTCDPIASVSIEGCPDNVEPIPTSCSEIPDCSLVCCYDSDEGICTENSPKGKCIDDGGEWNSDKSCSMDECTNICCILSTGALFITEGQCTKIDGVFKPIYNELDCLFLSATQFEGACIKDGKCTFTTEESCLSKGGKPYIGYLCSYPELNTGCEKQSDVGCFNGKDEIYWFDSCGNRENIYSSNEEASWNNGRVLSKELSCYPNSPNIGSTICGNCARPLSECSETGVGETSIQNGNYICKDLGCKNAPANVGTKDRIHGESWCLYDGYIGDGKDTVGSEHWIAYCNEGEVEIDRCGISYRGYLCQESTIEEDSKTFSQASCVLNQGIYCIDYNPLQEEDDGEIIDNEENIQKCKDNKHCMVKNTDVDDYFKFDMCVSRYPKGASLTNGIDDNFCSALGTLSCTVIYKKKLLSWECEENCECEEEKFAKQMNDLCISLGDCGSYVNYLGKGTDNVEITGKKGKKLDSDGEETDKESKGKPDTPSIYSWTNYQSKVNPVTGQHVKPQNIDEFLAQFEGSGGDYDPANYTQILLWTGTIPGAVGTAIFIIGSMGKFNLLVAAKAGLLSFAGFATAIGSVAIGMALGSYMAKWFGISGGEAVVMIISGGVAGLAVSFHILSSGSFKILGLSGFWIAAIIVALLIFIFGIFGIGKRETRIVEFTCMPWGAPTGKVDCEECNKDPLRPCTKYRCESLGQTCKILNENEENPPCESIEYEPNPPEITQGSIITEGYKFVNQQTKSVEIIPLEDGACIPEFTPVYFTLKTDEPAQCKYSFDIPPPTYEEMENNYPLEQNAFTKEHTFEIWMPSLDSSVAYNITGDLKEMFGNMNMYVRCQDYWENFNIAEYIVKFCINSGPDETAVNHALTTTNPENGATLKYGTNESDLTMWINEPADCKYDVVPGKDYDDMSNEMNCKSSLNRPSVFGWPCSTELTNLVNGENNFYIKCKDKPWVLTTEDIEEYGERNINKEDYKYILSVSSSELKIDSVVFTTSVSDKTITISSGETFTIGGVQYISVDMQVKTSGGMDGGESACYWGVLEDGSRYLFYNTFSNTHKQTLTPRFAGTHINYIECEDEAGNKVQTTSEFVINIDAEPPKVVRTYYENEKLNLITNEPAECYYDFNSCGFYTDDAFKFDSVGYSLEHIAKWVPGQIYYIKCKDVWENQNTDCAIRVIPSS